MMAHKARGILPVYLGLFCYRLCSGALLEDELRNKTSNNNFKNYFCGNYCVFLGFMLLSLGPTFLRFCIVALGPLSRLVRLKAMTVLTDLLTQYDLRGLILKSLY